MNKFLELREELRKQADKKRAEVLQRFFKTGKGEYGEGDKFLGITVPKLRKIAIKFKNLSFSEISKLLKSKIHEERLVALLMLAYNFNVGDAKAREKIYNFYLKNTKYINNWDLVDLSAEKIVGEYLFARQPRVPDDARLHTSKKQSSTSASLSKSRLQADRQPTFSSSESGLPRPYHILLKLADSKNIWERRIAIISTLAFIKKNKFEETLKISTILLNDKHDLIQKAVGWMLREIGKRDFETEEKFLKKYYLKMPRTILRYAIEKFPEKLKKAYLKRKD